MSGTSMSCPHVAGVAALVWASGSYRSGSAVRFRLDNTAEPLGGPTPNDQFGYGVVDAETAVAEPLEPVVNVVLSMDKTNYAQFTDEPAILTAMVYDEYGHIAGLDAGFFLTTIDDPPVFPVVIFSESLTNETYTATLDVSGLSAESHTVNVTVTDTRPYTGSDNATFNVLGSSGTLSAEVTTDKSVYKIGEKVYVFVTVTDEGDNPIEGARVLISFQCPGWKNPEDLQYTDGEGQTESMFRTKKSNGTGTCYITASVTKEEYQGGSSTIIIELTK